MKKTEFAVLQRSVLGPKLEPLGFKQKAIFGTTEKSWFRPFDGGFEAICLAVATYQPELSVDPFLLQRHDAIARLVNPHMGFASEKFERLANTLMAKPADLGHPELQRVNFITEADALAMLDRCAAFFTTEAEAFLARTRSVDEVVALYRSRASCTTRMQWPYDAMVGVAAAQVVRAPER
ncbi:MAG: hypothetical protein JST92_26170, partial [Deltaproteobacteria bacterium]|nr:hypothetical protein [Deltaproteobacteria bacterium]